MQIRVSHVGVELSIGYSNFQVKEVSVMIMVLTLMGWGEVAFLRGGESQLYYHRDTR